jgi:MFS transporter, FSR family, fosmidomycin resistance protein
MGNVSPGTVKAKRLCGIISTDFDTPQPRPDWPYLAPAAHGNPSYNQNYSETIPTHIYTHRRIILFMLTPPKSWRFWAVSLAHSLNDAFMAIGSSTLTFMSSRILPMTPADIGNAEALRQMCGSLSQPLFGWLTDRYGGRWVGSVGMAVVVLGYLLAVALALTTANYWLMFVPYVLSGFGSGAYHPAGSAYAVDEKGRTTNSSIAWFFAMGNIAGGVMLFIIGPLLTYPAAPMFGLTADQQTFLPIFVMGLLLVLPVGFGIWRAIPPKQPTAVVATDTALAAPAAPFQIPVMPFVLLTGLIVLRSFSQGAPTFIPLLFKEKGADPSFYTGIQGSFWLAMGVAGLFIGQLAERFDRRWVLATALVLAAPLFVLLPQIEVAQGGQLAYVIALAIGALSGGTHSLLVAMAQDLLPSSKGLAAGLVMGVIFSTGAAAAGVIGQVSTVFTLPNTFAAIGALTVAAALSALWVAPQKKVQTLTA